MPRAKTEKSTPEEKCEIIANALRDFLEAKNVIEWLQQNHIIGENVDADELAHQYAISYSSQRDILSDILTRTKA